MDSVVGSVFVAVTRQFNQFIDISALLLHVLCFPCFLFNMFNFNVLIIIDE